MISVNIANENNYSLDLKRIEKEVLDVLVGESISDNTEVSVAIVDDNEISRLAQKYLGDSPLEAANHPVLSFLTSEMTDKFVYPPDGINHLGEVLVSYQEAFKEAAKSGKNINDVVVYWARHGTTHLTGKHHD